MPCAHRAKHGLIQQLLLRTVAFHAGTGKSVGTRSSLRLLACNSVYVHCFDIDECAFKSIHGRTLGLIAE